MLYLILSSKLLQPHVSFLHISFTYVSGRQTYTYRLHTFYMYTYKSLQRVNYRKLECTSRKNQTVHFCVFRRNTVFSETVYFQKTWRASVNSGNVGKSMKVVNIYIYCFIVNFFCMSVVLVNMFYRKGVSYAYKLFVVLLTCDMWTFPVIPVNLYVCHAYTNTK